jgi:hypothetical protein
VVAFAEWADVVAGGGAAGGVVVGVVLVGFAGGSAAAGVAAGAVADFDVAGERGPGEPVADVLIYERERVCAVGVLVGEVGDHPGPGVAREVGRGEVFQGVGVDVQLDDPASAASSVGGGDGRSSAGGPGEQQQAVGVGDGEAPLGAEVLGVDECAGDAGQDRTEAGYLAALVVEVEQGGQPDADLDAGLWLAGGTGTGTGTGTGVCV